MVSSRPAGSPTLLPSCQPYNLLLYRPPRPSSCSGFFTERPSGVSAVGSRPRVPAATFVCFCTALQCKYNSYGGTLQALQAFSIPTLELFYIM